ncbi:hypothetical protein V1477_015959 [Vespula maculifrons]|uniref:Uncharacterized protein n=1 Tax=Vespula maculifrons TaxID=7453 RepID=A0ABD2BBP5_VESMC
MKRLWGKSFIGSHGSGRHEHLADRTSESQSKFPTIKAWSGTKYSQRKEHTLAHFPKTLADHLEYGNISHRRLESLLSLRHVSRQINFRKHPLVVTTTSLGYSSNHVLTRLVEFAKHKSRSEEVSRLGLVFTSSAHVEEEESVGMVLQRYLQVTDVSKRKQWLFISLRGSPPFRIFLKPSSPRHIRMDR